MQDVEYRRFAVLTGVVECLQDILFRKIMLHAFEGLGRRIRHRVSRFGGYLFGFLIPLLLVESSSSAASKDDGKAAYDPSTVRAFHYSGSLLRRNLSRGWEW